jgi:hypothetical protein
MPNARSTEVFVKTNFDIDEDGNIIPGGTPIFEEDVNGDLMPSISGTEDPIFEINEENEITTKV